VRGDHRREPAACSDLSTSSATARSSRTSSGTAWKRASATLAVAAAASVAERLTAVTS